MLKFKVCYYNLLQLNSAHINKFKKEISDGRAPKTINAYIDTLKRVWDLARTEWGIVLPPQNPFALVSRLHVNNERDITLTDEQFARLIEEAGKVYIKSSRSKIIGKANWLPDMIIFAAATAARFSEIINLLRKDVDFNKKLATFRDTKNGEDRTIPLSEAALQILKKQPFGERFFNIKSRETFKNYWNKAREADAESAIKNLTVEDGGHAVEKSDSGKNVYLPEKQVPLTLCFRTVDTLWRQVKMRCRHLVNLQTMGNYHETRYESTRLPTGT